MVKMAQETWPITKLAITPEAETEIEKECKAKPVQVEILSICSGEDDALLYNRFQDWEAIINITAYIYRIYRRGKKETACMQSRYLMTEERIKAIEFWIKYEQQRFYQAEIESIKAGEKLPHESNISDLRPFLDKNGLLRVGGRIGKSSLAYGTKHQYIIPRKSRLSY